jgi:hypothetical protein
MAAARLPRPSRRRDKAATSPGRKRRHAPPFTPPLAGGVGEERTGGGGLRSSAFPSLQISKIHQGSGSVTISAKQSLCPYRQAKGKQLATGETEIRAVNRKEQRSAPERSKLRGEKRNQAFALYNASHPSLARVSGRPTCKLFLTATGPKSGTPSINPASNRGETQLNYETR